MTDIGSCSLIVAVIISFVLAQGQGQSRDTPPKSLLFVVVFIYPFLVLRHHHIFDCHVR